MTGNSRQVVGDACAAAATTVTVTGRRWHCRRRHGHCQAEAASLAATMTVTSDSESERASLPRRLAVTRSLRACGDQAAWPDSGGPSDTVTVTVVPTAAASVSLGA